MSREPSLRRSQVLPRQVSSREPSRSCSSGICPLSYDLSHQVSHGEPTPLFAGRETLSTVAQGCRAPGFFPPDWPIRHSFPVVTLSQKPFHYCPPEGLTIPSHFRSTPVESQCLPLPALRSPRSTPAPPLCSVLPCGRLAPQTFQPALLRAPPSALSCAVGPLPSCH